MPKIKDQQSTPPNLRPYLAHGMELEWESEEGNAIGVCPFCGKEGKFSVKIATGQWRCFVCAVGTEKGGGNVYTFLRLLWSISSKEGCDYESFALNRSLLFPETMVLWGIVKSALNGNWLVPGYDAAGKLNQLYRYVRLGKEPKPKLLATPGTNHALFGSPLFKSTSDWVYVCEGPWDAMAIWEVMGNTRKETTPGGAVELVVTGSRESSLLSQVSVLGVPGCNVFAESWIPLLTGRKVAILFDNDHPKTLRGKQVEVGGLAGVKLLARKLSQADSPPDSIYWLRWGERGWSGDLPSGHDVRDVLKDGTTLSERIPLLADIISKIEPVPDEWLAKSSPSIISTGKAGLDTAPCSSWASLVNAWRKSGVKWIEGLDRALSVMLSCILSTDRIGDPLWCKIIGPPSCGKTILCEAVSVNRKYVFPKDTLTGLLSGYQADRSGETNMSLVGLIRGKTLVIKDGDTLVRAPNREQILSQFRALYDRALRSQYGNMMSTDWESLNATVIVSGTESLRVLDESDLGERFLDCVVVDKMEEEMEHDIGWRVALRAERHLSYQADGKLETLDSPEMVLARRMTGGYVSWLRENSDRILEAIKFPDSFLRRCQRLAEYVSFMRAKPSKNEDRAAQRELPFRLISQMVRLAKCMAGVLNLDRVDEEVMRRVRQTALDTSRGRTLELVKFLIKQGRDGASVGSLSVWGAQSENRVRSLLQFLRKIGVTEVYQKRVGKVKAGLRWRLSERFTRLFTEVWEDVDG